MKMKTEIQGLEKLLSELTAFEDNKKSDVSQIVKETAFRVQAGAKQRSPVDTGHLKRNIKVEIASDELSALVGTRKEDVGYAEHVEFGTSRSPAQPFLFPSAEEEYPEYLQKLAKAVGGK
jgi:HK97 gp10 family phage protein